MLSLAPQYCIKYDGSCKSVDFRIVLRALDELLSDLEELSLKDLKFLKGWLLFAEKNQHTTDPMIGKNRIKNLLKTYNSAIFYIKSSWDEERIKKWYFVNENTIKAEQPRIVYLPRSSFVESYIVYRKDQKKSTLNNLNKESWIII
jgi:hypothetical protein